MDVLVIERTMAPVGMTRGRFLQGIKGDHSGRERGVEWILAHNGVLVSTRTSVNFTAIETYRVSFASGDCLLTWGLGGVRDLRHGAFPDEWRVVWDRDTKGGV